MNSTAISARQGTDDKNKSKAEKSTAKGQPEKAQKAVAYAEVPIDLLGYKASPQVTGRFKLPALRTIAQHFSPIIVTLLSTIENESDVQACLSAGGEKVNGEVRFWHELTKGLFLLDRARVNWLVARGIEFRKGESKSEFVARALTEHADDVRAVLFSWLQESGEEVGGRSYLVFPAQKSAQETAAFLRGVKSDKLMAALKPYFEKQGYSDHCEVVPVEEAKGKRGFVLDRASHQDAKFVLDSTKQKKQRNDRDLLTDYVFYHQESNTLWVHARSPRDGGNYADTIAFLTGNPEIFQEQLSFDLSPVNRLEFANDLTAIKQKFSKKVSLRYVRKKDPKINFTGTISADRYEDCLSGRMEEVIGHPMTKILEVGFAIALDPAKKSRAKIEFSPGKIKLGEGVTVEQAMMLAASLGFIKPYANS